jgi:bifunctional UDP-N-acetylglucosamine pyrophosphorylase/glucosamine-1-phosphate N-acetyltransferase
MATEIIILAAGQGTRMKSDLPKVLHAVCGEPMLLRLLKAADRVVGGAGGASFNIVVGHGREAVTAAVHGLVESGGLKSPVRFTVQAEQLGTGHAVKLALDAGGKGDTVAVLSGDVPLMAASDLQEFLDAHVKAKSVATLASTVVEKPTGYGRVVRKGKTFHSVVEEKDASPRERAIREINGGIYLFKRDVILKLLPKLKSNNKGGEFYLPDLFSLARKAKLKTLAHVMTDGTSLLGANNMADLAEVERLLRVRINGKWVEIRPEDLKTGGATVDATLADYARMAGLDLLVMGAFGHNRTREFVLGGVTRRILDNPPLPVLLAH